MRRGAAGPVCAVCGGPFGSCSCYGPMSIDLPALQALAMRLARATVTMGLLMVALGAYSLAFA